jgi:hypothetical protein
MTVIRRSFRVRPLRHCADAPPLRHAAALATLTAAGLRPRPVRITRDDLDLVRQLYVLADGKGAADRKALYALAARINAGRADAADREQARSVLGVLL